MSGWMPALFSHNSTLSQLYCLQGSRKPLEGHSEGKDLQSTRYSNMYSRVEKAMMKHITRMKSWFCSNEWGWNTTLSHPEINHTGRLGEKSLILTGKGNFAALPGFCHHDWWRWPSVSLWTEDTSRKMATLPPSGLHLTVHSTCALHLTILLAQSS